MNKRKRQIGSVQRADTIPSYNREKRYWKVFVDGRKEWGSLEYVCSEFVKTGLYYPFHLKGKEREGWEHHEHDFESVLRTLLEEPGIFSVEGFDEYYSKQEVEFLNIRIITRQIL